VASQDILLVLVLIRLVLVHWAALLWLEPAEGVLLLEEEVASVALHVVDLLVLVQQLASSADSPITSQEIVKLRL
jgi:hypothetical protein